MAKYERCPDYVAGSPQQVAAARTQLTELRKNSAFALMQGARRAAIAAKFHSKMPLTPLEYVEFGDIVPLDFNTRSDGRAELRAEQEAKRRKMMAEFQEQERKRREAPRPMTRAEAQAYLSTADYIKWVDSHQELIARENF